MNESELTELLDRAGEQTPVGPPPIEALHAGARRRRRRRTAAVSFAAAAAVAVAVAAGGTALLVAPGANLKVPAASTPPSTAVPAELRLVGIGQVAIAVPRGWGTNQQRCMTPQQDTVIFGPRSGTFCGTARPAGVESVELGSGDPGPHFRFNFQPDEKFEIDGVRAERQRTSCAPGGFGAGELCSGIVYFPTLKIWFRAESSTNAGEVDRILERIRLVPDRVGIPDYQGTLSSSNGKSGQSYADLIADLGLHPVFTTAKAPNYAPGGLLKVSPIPGTMVTPGSTVTLTVTSKN